jgi:uncharacterized coiled-coil DUF342 family protein
MSLESLKRRRSEYRKKLAEEKAKLDEYRKKAEALDDLYKKMKEKKSDMKGLDKDLKSFSDESYPYWQGNVFRNRYEVKVKTDLIDDGYDKMIDIIDANLDEINNERTRYENLVYESNGIIGRIEESINSIITRIENWVN